MEMLSTFKTTARAAVVAIALGATAFAAAPAQAAPTSSFSLQLGGGSSGSNVQLYFGDDFFNYCLTNGQIKVQLAKHGFKSVQIVKKLSPRKVVAVGRYFGTWYEMRVDRCTGKVDKVRKLKNQHNTGNSFSITLSF